MGGAEGGWKSKQRSKAVKANLKAVGTGVNSL